MADQISVDAYGALMGMNMMHYGLSPTNYIKGCHLLIILIHKANNAENVLFTLMLFMLTSSCSLIIHDVTFLR